ncbi:MAG: type I methionyl aminopeptidase [Chloroflexi bacterium]|nr:type I methionyl aminopeptidase [Chloroflexota bacterium]MCH8349149.1 type I methionyl aminopeptidase [Chloroflexota bacterium]MCI0779994.1 type I methionyl aminopeptidase [Chloroflexota bacterium]MCI0785013.1 type I methionyl aminopeptidase [Chloroflexota bacterium]MCI0792487.1 type I methionyl aminopeptidase [Chloroflexota bacterium]
MNRLSRRDKIETASNSASLYSGGITIKSPQELMAMRRAGAVVGEVLTLLKRSVEPGMTTKELDTIAYKEIIRHGAKPTFKGYRGFPASICASINEEIVHGIPSKRVLKEGDIIKVDVGATLDGFIGDAAVSMAVGQTSPEATALMDATRLSLEEGIKAARPGNRVGDIGAAVQQFGEARGYGVVREFVGHGVGRFLHEDPQVPNYGQPGLGPLLRPGMCIAIEPMFNMGDWRTRILDDQWTVVTADGQLSAHFEHSIAITEDGPEILTGHT